LHRFLGIGLVVVAGALAIARQSGAMGPQQDDMRLPAFALLGLSVGMCAAALLLLKSWVPKRRSGQTVADYWSDTATGAKAFRFWFILEGSGVVASISYFLGGSPYSAALMAIAIAAFWMNGPGVFTRE
jgi:hypothetical protein